MVASVPIHSSVSIKKLILKIVITGSFNPLNVNFRNSIHIFATVVKQIAFAYGE